MSTTTTTSFNTASPSFTFNTPFIPPQNLGPSRTNVSVLDGIKVRSKLGTDVLVTDLWKGKRVLLAVFRRFGCAFCREMALYLSSMKVKLDEMGIHLIGIGFEPKEDPEFSLYWKGEIYYDEPRHVYEALGLPRLTKSDALNRLFDKRVVEAYLRVHRLGVSSNAKGDFLQPGGVFVAGPSPHGFLFEFRPEYLGDLPKEHDILQACSQPTVVFGVYNNA